MSVIRIVTILAMLYGLADLAYAQPAAPRVKTVYAYYANGAQWLSSVNMVATLVPPIDSTQFVHNTFNGSIYSTMIPVDSAQSGSNGRVAVRMPLTSDLSPTGTRVRIVVTWRGQTLFDTQDLATPNLALTDTTEVCLQKITGQTGTCP